LERLGVAIGQGLGQRVDDELPVAQGAFGSWLVRGAPRLSLLDGIASKENSCSRDVFVLAMLCASQHL
ncbi:MAG: hypothetical protein ACREI8_00780, partial [Myxococcota bacterium]